MLGLDYSGKSAILYQYKTQEFVKTIPTIGFNVETIDYKGVNLTIWDIGGTDKIRCLWKHYFQGIDGIIFVVDSNDRDRFEDSAEELKKLLYEKELEDCPILIMANKQDLEGAIPTKKMCEYLGVSQIKGRSWLLQGTSAKKGQGLKEGLCWLVPIMQKQKYN